MRIKRAHENMEIVAAFLGFFLCGIVHQLFRKWASFNGYLSTWYGWTSVQKRTTFLPENEIYEWAKKVGGNNVVTRQLQPTCYKLRKFDKTTSLNSRTLKATMRCYGCSYPCHKNHPVYVFSCFACGVKFQTNRHLTRDLQGLTAVVIGCRTKLGHQTVVKLLEAGATVVGTTRYPQRAHELYEPYPEWNEWKDRFHLYPVSFDLDVKVIADLGAALSHWIPGGKVDILVCCAAQTIRVREKAASSTKPSCGFNRYGDAKFVAATMVNSWQMTVEDLVQQEMEEVYRVNAIGPCLIFQQLLPNLKKSFVHPYIINVHAREGLFDVPKNHRHIHTNMAKAGLAMLTKCLKSAKHRTHSGKNFFIHGCDPGWISVDEYYEQTRPWTVPPLDEIDGAARILYPVMSGLQGSFTKTRRHFDNLLY